MGSPPKKITPGPPPIPTGIPWDPQHFRRTPQSHTGTPSETPPSLIVGPLPPPVSYWEPHGVYNRRLQRPWGGSSTCTVCSAQGGRTTAGNTCRQTGHIDQGTSARPTKQLSQSRHNTTGAPLPPPGAAMQRFASRCTGEEGALLGASPRSNHSQNLVR